MGCIRGSSGFEIERTPTMSSRSATTHSIPCGELPRETALALAAFLATLALVIAAALGFGSLSLLALFLALQAAYSLRLKHVVLLDVMTIGALFVIRAADGAVAVDVRISP